jgi:hypothetical protein
MSLGLVAYSIASPLQMTSPTGAGLKLITNNHEETILEAFRECKAMGEAQHPACRLVTIRDDEGAEFIGKQIAAWRKEHGIQAQYTVHATPEQNGRAEHGFRDLAEGATCILARAGMAVSRWAEAAHASNYVHNRFPHRTLHCAPFELWYGRKPNLAQSACLRMQAWHMSTCRRTRGRSPSMAHTPGFAPSLPIVTTTRAGSCLPGCALAGECVQTQALDSLA